MTAPPGDTTTDLHAVNEALRAERDAALSEKATLAEELVARTTELAERTAELAIRNGEYGERIEHQSATLDVLKAMAASPGDPQPVIDLICRHAQQLCNASAAAIYRLEGQSVTLHGTYAGAPETKQSLQRWRAQFPQPLSRGLAAFRAILDRQIIHVRDVDADPDLLQSVRDLGVKSIVAIPIFREGEVTGSISINAVKAGGFSESQIELLRTFAEQAVIAIATAETYRALQERTTNLQQSLEYQTATSDVLKVISRSTFDLQPVLDTVAETAARLCDADQAAIYRREGESARLVANFGFPAEYETYTKALGAFPIDPNAAAVGQRTLVEGRPVHVHDVAAVPGYWEVAIILGKQRTSLGVPLLREGKTIGNIMLARQRVEPFTDRQIELVSTFADQAVIAIENARLMTEQREALEQQTATAEVLQVINANPGNLQPVFDAMLEKAMRLCDARIWLALHI
jgi:GAF domain-containing protein